MLVAHYVGPPRPGLGNKIGWWAIKIAQKAPYSQCTHTEAIHACHGNGVFTIASASLSDDVRLKERVPLARDRWIITDVPLWDVNLSIAWFREAVASGMRYDKRGALATMLPGRQRADRAFCTEAVLAPFVRAAHYYTPALGLSLCLSIGRDVTAEVLSAR